MADDKDKTPHAPERNPPQIPPRRASAKEGLSEDGTPNEPGTPQLQIADGAPVDTWWSAKTDPTTGTTNEDQGQVGTTLSIQPLVPFPGYADEQLPSDWLKWEEDNQYSRDFGRLASTGAAKRYISGTVLARTTATEKWAPVAPGGSGGAEVAAGVLLLSTTVPASQDIDVTIIVRDATVVRSLLIFEGTPTPAQKDTAIGQLKTQGVVARQGA